jgi:hypothetical protein
VAPGIDLEVKNRFGRRSEGYLKMLALAHHFDEPVASSARTYRARVYGQAQDDGMWGGWIVFFPVPAGRPIATDRETTQSSLAALTYWASGLTHLYLHGALERALALQPEAQLQRELDRLDLIEESAADRAETLEAAASAARAESKLARALKENAEEELLGSVAETAKAEAQAQEEAAAASRQLATAAERALHARTRKKTTRKKK